MNWQQINEPGWGNPGNIGVFRQYGLVTFKGDLYSFVIGPGGVFKLVMP